MVDIRFMVLAEHSNGDEAFVSDVFTLRSERSLAEALETHYKEACMHWSAIQLPAGGSSGFLDGTEPDEKLGEPGWLTSDPYEEPLSGFSSFTGAELNSFFEKNFSKNPYNIGIIEFMVRQFRDRNIVLYLC